MVKYTAEKSILHALFLQGSAQFSFLIKTNTWVNGWMAKCMAVASFYGKMDPFTRANTNLEKNKEAASLYSLQKTTIQDFGIMANSMVKALCTIKMEKKSKGDTGNREFSKVNQ